MKISIFRCSLAVTKRAIALSIPQPPGLKKIKVCSTQNSEAALVPSYSAFLLSAILLAALSSAVGCSANGGGVAATNPTPAPTSTTLALSSSSANVGDSVTLTATVTAGVGSSPTGSVTFNDGTISLVTVALNSSGQAVGSSSTLAAGTHSLTASYIGNTSFAASKSSAAILIVAVPTLQSVLTLVASAATAVQGLPVELVATVAAASGSGLPTGMVTFSNGAINLGTALVDPTGAAHFTSTLLPAGANFIQATYNGDANYATSTSVPASVGVNPSAASVYSNPLTLNVTNSLRAESCADPAIYKDQNGGVNTWYLYCTGDALYAGDPSYRYINIFHSSDLVNWTYNSNAFSGLPRWTSANLQSLWAPAIKYFNGHYYLYYATPESNLPGNNGSAIGVGISTSPAGPFVDSGGPVVDGSPATNCCAGYYRSTIDPDEIQDSSGQRWIIFGSFTGGIFVRKLSADGLTSDLSSELQIAIDNRYEGGNWWFHQGYYYLFASATNCCNGPLSGYGVFVGRSTSPAGPYLDAQGISMAAINGGGTPVIKMNGNSVIGPGGNVIFTDEAGQDYILYHGLIDKSPYYPGSVGYSKRPGYIDAIDWVNGWPVTRGGFGPSDREAPQPLPAAQPHGTNSYATFLKAQDAPRTAIAPFSDSFTGTTLKPQWSFIHGAPPYALTGSGYQVQTVGFDTTNAMPKVPLLAEAAPAGDYMVETQLTISLPASGNGHDFAQAGLLIYGNDSNYVRLDLYSNSDTRQVEFIKAETAEAVGYPTWGGTQLGPPSVATQVSAWLRIVKRNVNGQEHYTAYSSGDGTNWIGSGTWTHTLGAGAKICLYAGNLAGFTAGFAYVRVSNLQ